MAIDAQPALDPALMWLDATLYRDEWGVPHVYARDPRALAFAFGYAQAEDHLEPMLFAYRVANGRAAEIAGEPYANSDAFSISMGHARLAVAALDVVDPVTRDLCEGFALGVNAWIAQNPAETPPWCEGVSPPDVLALWHAFLMSMAPWDLPELYHRPRAIETGNAWALAPARTEQGKTLLVINPHDYFDGPFRWYEAHLAAGDLDVTGVTLYGLPVIIQGHNGYLGWALTPNWPDFADIFEEQFAQPQRNPNDPRLPRFDAEFMLGLEFMSNARPYYVRTPAGLEERFTPALINSRGPVFQAGGGGLHSWRIGGYRDFGGFYQLMEMGRARDLGAFQAALMLQQLPCFHVLYADQAGNLFYTYNAKTGTRELPPPVLEEREKSGRPPITWQTPEKAALDGTAWVSVFLPDQLPYVMNPKAGYLQACGNPPWSATDDAGPQPEAWPPWLIQDIDTPRAQRVRRLLRTGQRGFRDMQSMVYDALAPAAAELTPVLIEAAGARPDFVKAAHPDLAGALDLLQSWNCVADVPFEGMTFYHAWWTDLVQRAAPVFPSSAALHGAMMRKDPQVLELALNAAAEAARSLRNTFDSIRIPWGDAHKIRRGKREEAIGGSASGDPVFRMGDSLFDRGAWYATYGCAHAFVIEFDDPPRMVSVARFGASDNPDSPHFDDQLDLLLEHRFKVNRFTRDEVWRYAQSAYGRRVTLFPLGVTGAFTFEAPREIDAVLRTAAETAAPLPEGLIAFTSFVRPSCDPASTPVSIVAEMEVPQTLCRPDLLPNLALYVYEEGLNWRPVPEQTLDAAARRITGRHSALGLYAVLGPAWCGSESAVQEPVQAEPSPEPAPELPTDLPQIWDAAGQEPPGKFKFEVLVPVPEKDEEEPAALPPAFLDPNRERKFRIEPVGGASVAPEPGTEPENPAAAPPEPPLAPSAHESAPSATPEPAQETTPGATTEAAPAERLETPPEAAPEPAPTAGTDAGQGSGDGKPKFRLERLNRE
ncbi:MAG: penicillin acylase family protein [Candidatus Hydrogenedentes bacterium]|nr:penicillin acylase family protein [Candidatus Hydrogenedentota bacterium]